MPGNPIAEVPAAAARARRHLLAAEDRQPAARDFVAGFFRVATQMQAGVLFLRFYDRVCHGKDRRIGSSRWIGRSSGSERDETGAKFRAGEVFEPELDAIQAGRMGIRHRPAHPIDSVFRTNPGDRHIAAGPGMRQRRPAAAASSRPPPAPNPN